MSKTILARTELNKKYGCIDTLGNEVIPIKYDDIGFWGNNLIPVNIGAKEKKYELKGGKWGYCNSNGELVIDTKFDGAERFSEGLAPVKIGKKWGFIDITGKVVIEPQFDETRVFMEGLCPVGIAKKWGFINNTGKIIIPLEYGEVYDFQNGVTRAFVGKKAQEEWEESEGFYCLINNKGERLTQPVYKMIWWFSEGLARVEIQDGDSQYSTKTGFINQSGELVVPTIYDRAEDFSDGMAAVGIKNKKEDTYDQTTYTYGYVNSKGEEVIKIQYSRADRFYMGRAVVGQGMQRMMYFSNIDSTDNSILNHKDLPIYALIDKNGNYILDFDWGQLTAIDNNHFIAQRAKYTGDGVIDVKGQTIIPFEYINLSYARNGIFTANDGGVNGETTVLDLNNKIMIKSNKFAIPSPKYEFGLLHIRTNRLSKSGFIDLNGNMVIKDKYDMVWEFESTE